MTLEALPQFPKYAFLHLEDVEEAAQHFAEFGYFDDGEIMATTDQTICREEGHDLIDCSSGGPDSGNMDHECARCGRYWSVPLY